MRYSSGIGISFGKYSLVRKLAAGGMAEIFLAETTEGPAGPTRLVIKRILPHLTDDETFLEMFLDEARIAARLRHQGVIQILDLGRIDDSLFIAMEYVRGEDLANVLKASTARGRPMPPQMAAAILSRVADALDYAHAERDLEGHAMQIVHRDVTPQNIMVGFDGSVKLLDFGIAKVQGQLSRTKPGTVKGKYFYMSPEQCRGKELDGRSDLFSVGILLYEMTTGVRPFAQESEFDTLKMIVNSEPLPPSVHVVNYPLSLAQIVERALRKDREGRYPTGRALKEALTGYLADTGQTAIDIGSYLKDLFPDRANGDPEDSSTGRKAPSDSGLRIGSARENAAATKLATPPPPLLPFDSDSSSATEALALRPLVQPPMPLPEEPSISIVSDPNEFAQVNSTPMAPLSDLNKTVRLDAPARMPLNSEIGSEPEPSEVSALTRDRYQEDDEGTGARKKEARWFANLLGAVALGLALGSVLAFARLPGARQAAPAETREPPSAVASTSELKKTRVAEPSTATKNTSARSDSKRDRDRPKTVKKVSKKTRKTDRR